MAQKLAIAKGALKAQKVAVSGAFHTPLMLPAKEKLLKVSKHTPGCHLLRMADSLGVRGRHFSRASDSGLLKCDGRGFWWRIFHSRNVGPPTGGACQVGADPNETHRLWKDKDARARAWTTNQSHGQETRRHRLERFQKHLCLKTGLCTHTIVQRSVFFAHPFTAVMVASIGPEQYRLCRSNG